MTPIAERIIGALAGARVRPGEIATVEVARIMAHDGTGPVVARALHAHGIEELAGADRAIFVFDHYYPPAGAREAELQRVARKFAEGHGIPVLAGEGIAHQVLPERGLVAPGTVLVGADSHTCMMGAVGAYAAGLGATDVAAVLATGQVWLEVPRTLKIRLHGELPIGAASQDLVLQIIATVGCDGALGMAIEFCGPAVSALTMSDRLKLADHAVEMGAVAGLVGVDDRCAAWLRERGASLEHADRAPLDHEGHDADVEIDLADVQPLAALPSRPDRGVPLDQIAPVDVDQVFIGSCAGGRLDDLRAAAEVLRGRRVAIRVRLLVGPASAEVYRDALADGTLATLSEAGAVVLPPGCGACMGRLGTLGDGEISVTTQNRNFTGRAGAPSSELYLASAHTAALAALSGRLGPQAEADS